jgi:hypothetical protein
MSSKTGEITEEEVALLVCRIASEQSDDIATYDQIRDEVPHRHNLSAADLTRSVTSRNETMWEQKIRNIKSHDQSPGNFVHDGYLEHVPEIGYRVTDAGKRLVGAHVE